VKRQILFALPPVSTSPGPRSSTNE